MFSLRETDDGRFIYRCHRCGSECELAASDQAMAGSKQLYILNRTNVSRKPHLLLLGKTPKAS